jgi:hypothetical protein
LAHGRARLADLAARLRAANAARGFADQTRDWTARLGTGRAQILAAWQARRNPGVSKERLAATVAAAKAAVSTRTASALDRARTAMGRLRALPGHVSLPRLPVLRRSPPPAVDPSPEDARAVEPQPDPQAIGVDERSPVAVRPADSAPDHRVEDSDLRAALPAETLSGPWTADDAAATPEPSVNPGATRWQRLRDWTVLNRQRLVLALTLTVVFGAALIIVLPILAFRETISTNRTLPRVETRPQPPPTPAAAPTAPTDEQGARILSQGAPIRFDPFSTDIAPTATGFTGPRILAPPFTATDSITLTNETGMVRLAHVHGLDRNAVCIDEAGLKFACGLAARASLQNQLTQRTLTCLPEFYPGEIRYQCSNGELDLARHQVARGYAWPQAPHLVSFLDAVIAARAAGAGAWRGGFVLYDTTSRINVPASPLAIGDNP